MVMMTMMMIMMMFALVLLMMELRSSTMLMSMMCDAGTPITRQSSQHHNPISTNSRSSALAAATML